MDAKCTPTLGCTPQNIEALENIECNIAGRRCIMISILSAVTTAETTNAKKKLADKILNINRFEYDHRWRRYSHFYGRAVGKCYTSKAFPERQVSVTRCRYTSRGGSWAAPYCIISYYRTDRLEWREKRIRPLRPQQLLRGKKSMAKYNVKWNDCTGHPF